MTIYSAAILADSPVLYHRLNEASGTAAVDLGSAAANGVYGAGATLAQSGAPIVGETTKSVSFSGASTAQDYIATIPTSLATANLTMECWILMQTGTVGCAFKIGSISGAGVGIGVGAGTAFSGGNHFMILYEGVRWNDTGLVISNGWHHIAIIAGAGIALLDGHAVSIGTGAAAASVDVSIGGYSSRMFNSNVEEAAAWNSQLTGAKVITHYQTGVAGAAKPIVISGGTYSAAVMADNPTLYLPMTDTAAGSVLPAGTTGPSSVANVATRTVGPNGDGAYLMGGDSPIQFTSWPNEPTAVADMPLLFEMWLYPYTANPYTLFDGGSGTTLVPRALNAGQFTWQMGGGNAELGVAYGPLTVQTWSHVVGRYSWDGSTRTIDTYVNGVYLASVSAATSLAPGWGPTRIGSVNDTSPSYSGRMAHFAIYSRKNGNTRPIVGTGVGTTPSVVAAINRHYLAMTQSATLIA